GANFAHQRYSGRRDGEPSPPRRADRYARVGHHLPSTRRQRLLPRQRLRADLSHLNLFSSYWPREGPRKRTAMRKKSPADDSSGVAQSPKSPVNGTVGFYNPGRQVQAV